MRNRAADTLTRAVSRISSAVRKTVYSRPDGLIKGRCRKELETSQMPRRQEAAKIAPWRAWQFKYWAVNVAAAVRQLCQPLGFGLRVLPNPLSQR
jgi:hypothetical protein